MKSKAILKKVVSLFIVVSMICSLLPVFTQNVSADQTVNRGTKTIEVGQRTSLSSDGGSAPYYWSSSDTSVAVIDGDSTGRSATVIAVGTGTATVTLESSIVVRNDMYVSNNDIEDYYETWTIEVTGSGSSSGTTSGNSSSSGSKKITPTSITLNKSTLSLIKGKSEKLKYTISPSNANSKKKVTFTSSNPNVAKVGKKGKVTALKKGTATITASTANGRKATCKVTVKEINASKITLNKKKLKLVKGKTARLTYKLTPSNATSSVKWTSSNKKVASVNSNGKVTAKKGGTTTIKAKTSNGKTASCKVTVKVPITGVSLNKSSVTLKAGKTCKLKATVKPSDTTASKKVKWSSSNKNVAAVNSKGKVTAKKAGTATITATTSNGKTATCKVKVKVPITSVSMSCTDKTVDVGETFDLDVTITPDNTSEDTTVTWRSSDTSVATVDSSGKVTAVDDGYCSIIAEVGGWSVICRLTVERPITSISLNYTSLNLTYSACITATFTAGTTDDKTITWTSSDDSVAKITSVFQHVSTHEAHCYIFAVGPGTCTITATTSNGLTATCEVTVPDD